MLIRMRSTTFFPAVFLTAVFASLGLTGCATQGVAHEPFQVFEKAHSGGNALAIDSDSELGASAGWSGRVRIWRLKDGFPLGSWQTDHGDLFGLLFLDGDQLLTAGYDGYIRIWSLNGTLDRSFKAGAEITSFRASKDRSHVFLGHGDGRVSLWHVNGEQLGSWQLSSRRIAAVAIADDLQQLAAGDSAANVWRWRPNELPLKLASPPTYARSLIFLKETNRLLGSGWFDLYSWRADDVAVSIVPTDHRGIINHLESSPDGTYLASISRQTDSAVLLLNPDDGQSLSSFQKHALCGQRVAVSPDGQIMMSNSDDASVRFYQLTDVSVAREANGVP